MIVQSDLPPSPGTDRAILGNYDVFLIYGKLGLVVRIRAHEVSSGLTHSMEPIPQRVCYHVTPTMSQRLQVAD